MGPNEKSTTEPWKAACCFCKYVECIFKEMLDTVGDPQEQAVRMFELRETTGGDRALVTLLGF